MSQEDKESIRAQKEIMRATIDRSRDTDGNTYLHELAARGAVKRLLEEAIVEFGANPESLNKGKQTPLSVAIRMGHIQTALDLLALGCRLYHETGPHTAFNGLYSAIETGNTNMVRALLRAGADQFIEMPGVDFKGDATSLALPLYCAVEKDRADLVEMLLIAGALPNAFIETNKGRTPLLAAVEKPSLPMCALLLEYGADPSAQGSYGHAPLHSAIAHRRIKLVELLVDHGADLDAQNIDGQTPTMQASQVYQLDTLKILIAAGANLDIQNEKENGETALMIAARRVDPETTVELLSAGANPLLTDVFNKTAANYIEPGRHNELKEFIEQQETEAIAKAFDKTRNGYKK